MTENVRIPIDKLESALRTGGPCASPERIAAAMASELPAAERAALLAHAESCVACAAEMELARGFFQATESGAAFDEAFAQLPESLAATRPVAKVLPMRPHHRPAATRPAVWAVAASVLLAVALGVVTLRDRGGSALPDRPIDDVVRGGRIEIMTPLGVREEAPASISWSAVEGAARYRVEILGVDGDPVASVEVDAVEWALPESVRSGLETFVAYRVRVVALDGAGGELGGSPAAELRLVPAP